jgi:hypothetical protein
MPNLIRNHDNVSLMWCLNRLPSQKVIAVSAQFNESTGDVQSKLPSARSLCLGLLSHLPDVFRICPTQLSFTGAMQALEEFAVTLRLSAKGRGEQWDNLLKAISEIRVGYRPGRQEPRELKRRAKTYKLMTSPRDPNRNRYATAA